MTIRPYQAEDCGAVIDLWQRCSLVVPHNDPLKDILRKLADSPELFFIGTVDSKVIATVMVGYEGHRGWINYLAVSPDHQRQGCGRQLMNHAETVLENLGCPKINLQVRSTNTQVIAFYESLGFACDNALSLGKRLIHDDPSCCESHSPFSHPGFSTRAPGGMAKAWAPAEESPSQPSEERTH